MIFTNATPKSATKGRANKSGRFFLSAKTTDNTVTTARIIVVSNDLTSFR